MYGLKPRTAYETDGCVLYVAMTLQMSVTFPADCIGDGLDHHT